MFLLNKYFLKMKLGFRNISSRCGHSSIQRAFGREEPRRVAEQRRYAATLDRSVKWNLRDEARDDQSQRIAVKELPGNARHGAPDVPLDLTMAINKVLMRFEPKALRTDALQLRETLVNRRIPSKAADIRIRAKEIEREILDRDNIKVKRSRLSSVDFKAVQRRVEDELMPKLRSEFYHWKPVDFTPYLCAQYLACRFPEEYGVLTRIFSEIRDRLPDFSPEALLDYGSGVGSVSFAANAVFPGSIKEFMCVDTSPDMIRTARDVVDNGTDGEQPLLDKVYFRQHFPGSHERQYDLCVSAFTLLELPTAKDRLQALRSLWNKTKRFLVIVELGNFAGYELIMEARHHLLGLDKVGEKRRKNDILDQAVAQGRIFAPCPHDLVCPRLAAASHRFPTCHFPVAFQPLPFMTMRNTPRLTSRYSYMVLEKTAEPRAEEGAWPRVVENVLKKHNHVVCRSCCPDGRLQEISVTKAKHGDTVYGAVRQARWGNRIPVKMEPKTEEELRREKETAEERQLRRSSRREALTNSLDSEQSSTTNEATGNEEVDEDENYELDEADGHEFDHVIEELDGIRKKDSTDGKR